MPSGTLYLVATPIGNLGDITLRALETLRQVDVVVSEDTRHTGVLLKHFEISKPQIACHEHNERQAAPRIIQRLEAGESVALVTSAGMPGISDPGFVLIRDAIEAGIQVTAIPGPTAFATALVLSGLPVHSFTFRGFPPSKPGKRRRFLEADADSPYTLIWCHGNAGTIGDRIGEFKKFVEAGFNVLLFDYRGYGESTGSPSADGIKEDALAVYQFLLKQGLEWHTLVPYGRSLGSGPAAYLANKMDVGGLILAQPITSTLEIGKHAYPFLPVGLILQEILDNETELAGYDGPLLIVHGDQDDVVPFEMGEKLYNSARSRQKSFVSIKGAGHNNLGTTYFRDLQEAISEFLNSL